MKCVSEEDKGTAVHMEHKRESPSTCPLKHTAVVPSTSSDWTYMTSSDHEPTPIG